MVDVQQWLKSLDLGQYADAFEKNDFDLDLLAELDHEILKDIGVGSAGHRVRILKAIKALDIPQEKRPDRIPKRVGAFTAHSH